MEYTGEFTDCTKLRRATDNTRYLRTDYGSTNTSSNGHASVSGALDTGYLCTFRKDGLCSRTPSYAPNRDTQRAVRSQQVQSQVNASFRSMERALDVSKQRSIDRHYARCTRLADDIKS